MSSKAPFAAALVGVLVGAAMFSTRALSPELSPSTLAFVRYLIGLGILAIPVCLALPIRFTVRDACAIAMLGVFQFGVLILLLNYAVATLAASTCALVFSTMPLFTFLLAVTTGREAFRFTRLVGIIIAVFGVVYLLGTPAADAGNQAHGYRAAMALVGATLTGAATSLLYTPYLRRYPALPTCALAMIAAIVFLALVCLLSREPLLPQMNLTQWGHAFAMGLSSGLGFLCWLWALARMAPSRVVAYQTLGPVTATTIEMAVDAKLPSAQLVLSLTLVCMGLLAMSFRKS